MADKVAAVSGEAPVADQPDGVRNVVLVGHAGSGKTTLAEALLVATGTIHRPGRVEDGTTVSDFEDAETRQQRSVSLSLTPFAHDNVKVNLLDTPGYADFVGELRAGLRAADCAVFVVSAAEPMDGATQILWSECAAVGMPRAVVISKLDHPRADYAGTLAACQAAFGDKVVPLYLPVYGAEGATIGVIGLLSGTVYDYSSGTRTESPVDESAVSQYEDARGALIEAIIEESEDETLMDRYLDGQQIDPNVLIDDLEKAVAKASFYPVMPVDSATGVGTSELLEIMTRGFPPPSEHPIPEVTTLDDTPRELTCDPDGPLLAEVIKTTTDAYVGRISLVRIFSGTMRPDQTVHVAGHWSDAGMADRGRSDHDEDERIGSLSSPLGKSQRNVKHAIAGDLCAVAKLSHAETGDTLSDQGDPLLMRPWAMPDPMLPVAIVAHAKADEDKLSQGLQRLAAEDPTLRIENNAETHQVVLWAMGEAHADVLLDRLKERYGVAVDKIDLRVPLRETLTGKATAKGRHVKQSGGHGQYAICDIEAEPLPEGAGFEFVDKVVGGAVPRQFIPSVHKGIEAQMAKGTTPAGYPMVDVRVTLFDGKAHSVDSSDMAFQTAGSLALREAASAAGVTMLEPVDEVGILVPDDYVGSIMGDLSGRRGRVQGTEPIGQGRTLVRAEVPQTEIVRYAIELRAIAQGTGTFSRKFVRYEPMPHNLAEKAKAAPSD